MKRLIVWFLGISVLAGCQVADKDRKSRLEALDGKKL